MRCELPISVVIPTFNAETELVALLKQVCGCVKTVIIVDGGSVDLTCVIASRYGVALLRGDRGRGYQMRVGGEHATTDWLLFLHADTVLEQGWQDDVSEFLRQENLYTCGGEYPVKLEPNMVICFPSWLEHKTMPNLTDKERITVAFNATIIEVQPEQDMSLF